MNTDERPLTAMCGRCLCLECKCTPDTEPSPLEGWVARADWHFNRFRAHRQECTTCRHAKLCGPFCTAGIGLWNKWVDAQSDAALAA